MALLFDFTKKDILWQTINKQNDFLAVQNDGEIISTSFHLALYITRSHSFRFIANKKLSKQPFFKQNIFHKQFK
ncbi:hypothetical protein DWW10_00665 [Bacteroides intestinalis]|uniref:Uncharacterized protein n=1 Tax=Bacteroides intestinalis TaxID=329854 RepID=A0A412YLD6_9BACE|nr:hypothetical protein DWW10_00665 [Bacteroides intestinalis]RHA63274.1 hypothetical protein DW932_00735 [Bacteroides intestinalis]